MTEEIIIDGINVAECILLCGNEGDKICCADDIRETENPFHTFCEDNPKCYYKQLKRLEQENKELRFIIEKYKSANERLYDAKVDDFNFTLKKYRSALEEIRILATKNVSIENFVKIQNKINEVLQQKVDLGFWDKDGDYIEDIQEVDIKEL